MWCASWGFARQRWRAWIETRAPGTWALRGAGSPVSDGGRGLKLHEIERVRRDARSPVSDGGRGLKQRPAGARQQPADVRPSAMAGVD